MHDQKKLTKQVSWNLVGQISSVFIPLITLSLILNSLGFEQFGEYSMLVVFGGVVALVNEWGFQITLVKYIKVKKGIEKKLFFNILIIRLIITLVFIAFILFVFLIANWYQLFEFSILKKYFFFLFFLFFANIINPIQIMVTLGRNDITALCIIFGKTFFLVSVIFSSFSQAFEYFNYWVFGTFLTNVAILLYIFWSKIIVSNIKSYELTNMSTMLNDGFVVLKGRVPSLLLNSSPVYLLSLTAGLNVVGIYSLADQLYRAGVLIVQSISTPLYISMNNNYELERVVKIVSLLIMLDVIGTLLVYNFFEGTWLKIFGSQSIDSFNLIPYFAIIGILAIISIIFGYPVLGPKNLLSVIEKGNWYGLIVFIATYTFLNCLSVMQDDPILKILPAIFFAELVIVYFRVNGIRKILN